MRQYPTNEHIARRLDEAADRILVRGWRRHGFVCYETGAVCALGAIYDAKYDALGKCRMSRAKVADAAMRELQLHLTGFDIAHWNDRIAADEHEVIDTMRLAAKDLRNRT